MADSQSFIKEIIGRFIVVALVVWSFFFMWWIPLIIAPLFWQIWDSLFGRHSRIYNPVLKLIADAITYVIWLSYIAYSIIFFGRNVGHWYVWLIGVILGIFIAQILGLLWPNRWHSERVERNL